MISSFFLFLFFSSVSHKRCRPRRLGRSKRKEAAGEKTTSAEGENLKKELTN